MSWKTIERGIRRYKHKNGNVSYYVDAMYKRKRLGPIRVGSTLKLAREARIELLNKATREEIFPELRKRPQRIRLTEFIPRYIDEYLKVKARRSWHIEEGRVQRLQELLGDPYLDEITVSDIERLLREFLRKGLSKATVNRYRSRLSSMLNVAIMWEYLEVNPVARVKRFHEEKLGDRYLEPDEYRALLGACEEPLKSLVILAVNTGMRRNELMTLRWDDVDLSAGLITIRPEISKTKEGRTVPINEDVRAVLNELQLNQNDCVVPCDSFPRRQWEKAVSDLGWDKTGIPRLHGWRFHDLRHACASMMVMADVPLYKVGQILGHKDLKTTQRYAHLNKESLFEAVATISAGFNNVRNGSKTQDMVTNPGE